jgi:hypothetical protein
MGTNQTENNFILVKRSDLETLQKQVCALEQLVDEARIDLKQIEQQYNEAMSSVRRANVEWFLAGTVCSGAFSLLVLVLCQYWR